MTKPHPLTSATMLAMRSDPSPLLPMLARHGAATLLVCALITVVLTAAGVGTWDVNLVYSISIGMLSWMSIEFGRFRFSVGSGIPWPQGWRGMAVVVAGMLIGFSLGTLIGQSYQGHMRPEARPGPFNAWLLPMLITVITSALMSFVFYLLGKSRHLQLQTAQAERQAAQARLALLQTQLEPHMLFNTLANLRALIDVDPARAQNMLDHLIDYLRMTLTGAQKTEHPLRDEFARLGDYLALMQIRMGRRLNCTLDLPDSLAHVGVPPLLLQPLVENSIRHGIEPQPGGGSIHVSARSILLDGDRFAEITVADSGLGLEPARQPAPGREDGTHMGLSLVRERLATRFGNTARFELASAPDQHGTIARVVFPLEASA